MGRTRKKITYEIIETHPTYESEEAREKTMRWLAAEVTKICIKYANTKAEAVDKTAI